jgi:hypothetical protein
MLFTKRKDMLAYGQQDLNLSLVLHEKICILRIQSVMATKTAASVVVIT